MKSLCDRYSGSLITYAKKNYLHNAASRIAIPSGFCTPFLYRMLFVLIFYSYYTLDTFNFIHGATPSMCVFQSLLHRTVPYITSL